ncbi:hypothetical protein RDWZM_002879 [Blomia tropicalis]|uniref:Solute carrier family 25 member 42 n=1 Tax=Blomia tropicalis TaxID=40697 RepID=A0A9Q0RRZ6_BLOTA|nr:hypothetical protein RDWZM_002879 [Blomia tropicalis]
MSQSDRLSQSERFITSLVAGAIAGGIAKTAIAPLDRTKINFQIQNKIFSFNGAFEFLATSYKRDGITSLWRGNSATMARIIPYAAIQYSSHEQFKHLLKVNTNAQKKTRPHRSFIAGSLAGVISTSATYPLDLARARMAVSQQNKYHSLIEVFIKTIREEGAFALYRGLVPTLLGVIPYAGCSFFTYEMLKMLHHELNGTDNPHPTLRLLFGAIAGLIGQSASYPLDIVRRRMQTHQGYTEIGVIGTMIKVVHEEGIRHGLYKGLSLNWVKGPIAVGISFTSFDLISNTIRTLIVVEPYITNGAAAAATTNTTNRHHAAR